MSSYRVSFFPSGRPHFESRHPAKIGSQLTLPFSHWQDEILSLIVCKLISEATGAKNVVQGTLRFTFQIIYAAIMLGM